jgi:hypothetical protein
MSLTDSAASATLRIEHGDSRGSGFHFVNPVTVITNYHVISGAEKGGNAIKGITERGDIFDLELVAFSPANQRDYAVLRVRGGIPAGRSALKPKILKPLPRGIDVLFAGFPHGIPHLLVQRAVVAGLITPEIFYIDGSVNGGNSGGPIIDAEDGAVIGVVTQRRFLGAPDLEALRKAAKRIQDHCDAIADRGSVQIMGIDFGGFSKLMAQGMILIQEVLEANANTGIGIGYAIEFAAARCAELGIE